MLHFCQFKLVLVNVKQRRRRSKYKKKMVSRMRQSTELNWIVPNWAVCLWVFMDIQRERREKCRHSAHHIAKKKKESVAADNADAVMVAAVCLLACCGGCHSFSYRLVGFLCVREFSVFIRSLKLNIIQHTLQILSFSDAHWCCLSHCEISTNNTHKIKIIESSELTNERTNEWTNHVFKHWRWLYTDMDDVFFWCIQKLSSFSFLRSYLFVMELKNL